MNLKSPYLNNVQHEKINYLIECISSGLVNLEYRSECVCGCDVYTMVSESDRFDLPFSSFLCNRCGLMFTSPFISENSLYKYYNEIYHPITFGKEEPLDDLFSKGQGDKIYHIVSKFLDVDTLKVFEVGAGSGTNLIEFAKSARENHKKVELYGLEYNVDYVKSAKEKGIDLYSETLEDFTSRNIAFDVIILSHVFEHFVDPLSALENIKKISDHKTILYVEVPGIKSLLDGGLYDFDFKSYLTHAHTFNYTISSLKTVMSICGYRCLKANEKIESVFIFADEVNQFYDSNNQFEIKLVLKDLEKLRTKFASKYFLKKMKKRFWRMINK